MPRSSPSHEVAALSTAVGVQNLYVQVTVAALLPVRKCVKDQLRLRGVVVVFPLKVREDLHVVIRIPVLIVPVKTLDLGHVPHRGLLLSGSLL